MSNNTTFVTTLLSFSCDFQIERLLNILIFSRINTKKYI